MQRNTGMGQSTSRPQPNREETQLRAIECFLHVLNGATMAEAGARVGVSVARAQVMFRRVARELVSLKFVRDESQYAQSVTQVRRYRETWIEAAENFRTYTLTEGTDRERLAALASSLAR